ncbi:MAG: response regulator [Elusimicrobiota bacterium]|nr:response regulator [Elusimicrobiota bacterium]
MAKKLLAVDDDPGTLDFYQIVFEKAGFTVEVAADATSAIMLCVDFKPDIMLLDWEIPGGGGRMVFEKICGLLAKDIPVLFVTGCPEKVDAAIFTGTVAVLQKPVAIEKLVLQVNSLLK